MSGTTVVEVEGLAHFYGARAALDNVSFSVQPNEIFALLGPNGGGKSTILWILATLLFPTRGAVRIFGEDVRQNPDAIRRRMGVVFQSPGLDRKLTVRENLLHQGHLYGLRGRALKKRIDELLGRFGVADRAGEAVELLSGGLRRRVDLARAFLHSPQLLLLDEPTAGLDPAARRDWWSYLIDLREKDGVTILMTSHMLDEAELCDRLALLSWGRVVAIGSPASLKNTIVGEVIVLTSKDPAKLRLQIQQRFGGNPMVLDGTVRIEWPRGREFIGQILEAFPAEINAMTLSQPTLEDVFIHHTGRRFREEGRGPTRPT